METAKLTERQLEIVLGKIAPHVDRVTRSGLSEDRKLRAIGIIVTGEMVSVLAQRYAESRQRVEPSVLPRHDDATIGHLARWQRMMRKSRLPPTVQAEQLDRFERIELLMQRDDRTPRKRSQFDFDPDEEPHVSYYFE